jgi:hypothetical protein
MKTAALVDKLDDLLNPIAVKELRQAVKSRIVVAALTLFLVIQLAILILSLSFEGRRGIDATTLYAGREIFRVLQGILLATCMILIPAYAGVRLSSEHSETNVDLLFISTLRPRGIIAGKLQAAIVLILLIFSACAPFMTFTYLMRGIDIPSIALILAMDFLGVLLSTQAAIFLGTVPANMGLKLLLGMFGLSMMGMVFSYTMAGSLWLLEIGLGSRLETLEFWLIAGGAAIVVVAAIGLFFVWSVAIVSPPSANRALPVRLYMLAFWLVSGGVAALLAHQLRQPIPIYLWMDSFTVLLCTQILTTINERDRWGMRVLRTIPRPWWLRGPAFLLYSGSAGGVLFTVLLIALTIVLPTFALDYWSGFFFSPSSFLYEGHHRNSLLMTMIALYSFNYCMSAVWLRNVLFSKRIHAIHTWVIALLIGALGISLPIPLLFLFDNENWRMGQINPWWQITNPFTTIYSCIFEGRLQYQGFLQESLFFLTIWAFLMLLACMQWMVRQARRFHPPLTVSDETP